MKKKLQTIFSILALCLLGGATLVLIMRTFPAPLPADALAWMTRTIASPAQQTCSTTLAARGAGDGAIPSGCTVFTVSKGDQVFFGGNDDYINPDSYYWVDPGGAQGYGAIWVGTPDNVQQGVNETGLAYDANGLPRVDVNPHLEREPVSGGYDAYPLHILHECATVEEVIAWVNAHRWHAYMHDQMQFADATGDAVIISAGADGEVVFTRKPPGDGFLVSTNFNVANPANGYGYPCSRYETAQALLGGLVNQGSTLTAQDATHVLDAVHVEGGASWTIESMVADLPNGLVYLYYFHQFDKPLVLNVVEEIANLRAGGPLSRLFPEDVQQEATRRYQRIQARQGRWQVLGKVWLALVVTSLSVLLVGSIRERVGWVYWVPTVAILGPVGLLIRLVAGRKRRVGNWQAALVEAAGDVMPTIVAFVAVAVGLVLVPGASSSSLLPLLLFFGLPLFIGWLVFQGPLLAIATNKGYLHMLLQRLPHTWVATNLGIAVIFALATPLANMSVQMPLPPWTVVTWWALTAVSGLVAMLLLLLYEGWRVRRGYRGWYSVAWGEDEITSSPWRKLWWWIPLSYVALIGGIAGYSFIQQVLLRS
jgi:hypothetical protein